VVAENIIGVLSVIMSNRKEIEMYKNAKFYGALASQELPTKHKGKHHISKARKLKLKVRKERRIRKAAKDWRIHLERMARKTGLPFRSEFKNKEIHEVMVQDKQRRSEKRATNINIPILAFARGWR
jgi:hypothetical protein